MYDGSLFQTMGDSLSDRRDMDAGHTGVSLKKTTIKTTMKKIQMFGRG